MDQQIHNMHYLMDQENARNQQFWEQQHFMQQQQQQQGLLPQSYPFDGHCGNRQVQIGNYPGNNQQQFSNQGYGNPHNYGQPHGNEQYGVLPHGFRDYGVQEYGVQPFGAQSYGIGSSGNQQFLPEMLPMTFIGVPREYQSFQPTQTEINDTRYVDPALQQAPLVFCGEESGDRTEGLTMESMQKAQSVQAQQFAWSDFINCLDDGVSLADEGAQGG